MSWLSPVTASFLRRLYPFLILVALVFLSTVMVRSEEATSKATWEVERGIPFPVALSLECRGPCPPVGLLDPGTLLSVSVPGLALNTLCISAAYGVVWLIISWLNTLSQRKTRARSNQ